MRLPGTPATMTRNIQLLIPAGGMGTRLGRDLPKALVPLNERPLIVHALEIFHGLDLAADAVVAVPAGQEAIFEEAIHDHLPDLSIKIIPGGVERQDSVRLGLAAIDVRTELVIIHDAARPFPPGNAIEQAIQIARETGAATLAIPCADTILQADSERHLMHTPDRSTLWACQTPQIFNRKLISQAHEAAHAENHVCTDDASLVKWNGASVTLVPGSATNLKITTPEDLRYAQFLLEDSNG